MLQICLINLGVGSQFTAMISGILLMAVLGMFNVHHHNTLNSAGVILYAFTSCKQTVSEENDKLEKIPYSVHRKCYGRYSEFAPSLFGFLHFLVFWLEWEQNFMKKKCRTCVSYISQIQFRSSGKKFGRLLPALS